LRREEFEHVVRAAARITEDEIVVIGSQAVLAQHPDAPDPLLMSQEADVDPRNRPERAADIDGAMGDGSRFHETYGYYAHAVGPETMIAPAGWEERLIRVDVPPVLPTDRTATAWCLETHDLILAKLAAGRPHDIEFVEEAIRARLADSERLLLGIELMPASHRDLVQERLNGALARVAG